MDNLEDDKGYEKNRISIEDLIMRIMVDNKDKQQHQNPQVGSDILIRPMPEWECPMCGRKSVIQRISRLENILKCKGCGWQRDLNFV